MFMGIYDWNDSHKGVGFYDKNISSDFRIWVLEIFIRLYITTGLAVTSFQTIMHIFLLRCRKDSM